MQITTTHNLLNAARDIAIHAEMVGDRQDWNAIANLIEQDTPIAYEKAADAWRLMDTYSRDLLTDYAKADDNVKHEAEAALSIVWNF